MNYMTMGIARRSTKRPDEPFNLLTFPTHESAETVWCKTNINVYAIRGRGIKGWNEKFRPLPKNYHLLSPSGAHQIRAYMETIPKDITFDAIVSQNIHAHNEIATGIAQQMGISLIELQHVLPNPAWSPDLLNTFKNRPAHKKIFITDYSRKAWGYNESEADVIRHGIETDLFTIDRSNQKKHILSVVNEFRARDAELGYKLWEEVTNGLPRWHVGHDPGFSEAATNVQELVNHYQTAPVFINTSRISPIPCSLLEAAACGCAIVTTNNCEIPYFFQHGENAMMSNDPRELREFCKFLLANEQERVRLGDAARQSIVEKCDVGRYVREWNTTLENLLT